MGIPAEDSIYVTGRMLFNSWSPFFGTSNSRENLFSVLKLKNIIRFKLEYDIAKKDPVEL
jgi:hypothetical protein